MKLVQKVILETLVDQDLEDQLAKPVQKETREIPVDPDPEDLPVKLVQKVILVKKEILEKTGKMVFLLIMLLLLVIIAHHFSFHK